ncbi:MAG: hypothetical protein ONB46_10830, partial [candidate division KSB1 bacterium]|nr:hypothetical protein [candidate division KSB1 bacterium]
GARREWGCGRHDFPPGCLLCDDGGKIRNLPPKKKMRFTEGIRSKGHKTPWEIVKERQANIHPAVAA